MARMTDDEAIAFLTTGTRTGKLATISADGGPHVTPIWFVHDNGTLVFNTWHESAKARNLRRDPRASLVVDLEEPPYAFVIVRGTVTLSNDLDEVRQFATNIGRRYMGEDRAEEFGARNGVEGELLARLSMDKVIAHGDVSS
jgi:PPOX class probable F420-dependent enzyme